MVFGSWPDAFGPVDGVFEPPPCPELGRIDGSADDLGAEVPDAGWVVVPPPGCVDGVVAGRDDGLVVGCVDGLVVGCVEGLDDEVGVVEVLCRAGGSGTGVVDETRMCLDNGPGCGRPDGVPPEVFFPPEPSQREITFVLKCL